MAVSELHIALLGAGAAGVATVWIYNRLQENKHRKLADKIFKGDQPDVLLAGQPPEPNDEVRIEPAAAPAFDRIEPQVEPVAEASPQAMPVDALPVSSVAPGPETQALPTLPAEWVDEIADCILRIEFAEAVAAPAFWSVQSSWAQQLGKTLTWMGYDLPSRQWRRLNAHDAGTYAHVAVALQLADRQGAVTEAELVVFLDGVQRLAQQFGGEVEVPHPGPVLDHAKSLDEFCASVDVQLGVNIIESSGGDFVGTKLRGLAEAAGMVLQGDGRFHGCNDDGVDMFTLANVGAMLFEAESLKTLTTHGVTFMLDVPRVADGGYVFDRMVAAARQMAQTLGGTLVDGQRHVLTEPMIAGIRAKIGEVQRQMAANQIPAGSPRALRLFS